MKKRASTDSKVNLRRYSSIYVEGPERAPSRAMLRAVGFSEEDFSKPVVGIASTWSMVTPCNMHIDKLANQAALGVSESGGKPVVFNTITVSDGISMGTPGMRYSLVSREVIADSIETVVGAEGFDGVEKGGFSGGVKSKKYANTTRKEKGEEDGLDRKERRPLR